MHKKEPNGMWYKNCDHCGLQRTPEGHDGCIGILGDGVMNACCGHGDINSAYVQFDHDDYDSDPNKKRIDGNEAINYINSKKQLQQYDALVLADSTHYRKVFEYVFRSEEEEARETLIEIYIDQARAMKGVFYSKKYNSIMFGLFDKQNKLQPNEFINRLKNTL